MNYSRSRLHQMERKESSTFLSEINKSKTSNYRARFKEGQKRLSSSSYAMKLTNNFKPKIKYKIQIIRQSCKRQSLFLNKQMAKPQRLNKKSKAVIKNTHNLIWKATNSKERKESSNWSRLNWIQLMEYLQVKFKTNVILSNKFRFNVKLKKR